DAAAAVPGGRGGPPAAGGSSAAGGQRDVSDLREPGRGQRAGAALSSWYAADAVPPALRPAGERDPRPAGQRGPVREDLRPAAGVIAAPLAVLHRGGAAAGDHPGRHLGADGAGARSVSRLPAGASGPGQDARALRGFRGGAAVPERPQGRGAEAGGPGRSRSAISQCRPGSCRADRYRAPGPGPQGRRGCRPGHRPQRQLDQDLASALPPPRVLSRSDELPGRGADQCPPAAPAAVADPQDRRLTEPLPPPDPPDPPPPAPLTPATLVAGFKPAGPAPL